MKTNPKLQFQKT